jgi:hypothetical protein
VYEQCTVAVTLSPESGSAGAFVVATGGPFGDAFDNHVQLDGIRADIVSIDRNPVTDTGGEPVDAGACDACDDCRERHAGRCNVCRVKCSSCVETLTFEVPAKQVGTTSVVVTNRWGTSEPVDFTVLGGATGTGSPGTADTSTGGTGTLGTAQTGDTGSTGIRSTGLPSSTGNGTGAGTGLPGATGLIDTSDTSALSDTGGTGAP